MQVSADRLVQKEITWARGCMLIYVHKVATKTRFAFLFLFLNYYPSYESIEKIS